MEYDRGRAKLGLYAPIDDVLGQYPPLYSMARVADLITYIDIAYKGGVPKSKDGIVDYTADRYLDGSKEEFKRKQAVTNHPKSLGPVRTSL